MRANDPAQRLVFCNWFLHQLNIDNRFLQNLIVSDEAIFCLNSEVNTRNVIQYFPLGIAHPQDHYAEFEQGANQIMVWIGLKGEGRVLGPHLVPGRLDTRE